MNKNFSRALATILPSKRINLFVTFLILLGIISGSLYLVVLSKDDKSLVINKITTFMNNINTNNINNLEAFKNAIISNFIFIMIIWVFGFSIIGIFVNIFLVYFKGFTIGFTISSFILTYKYKGIISSFIYMFPGGIINIIITLIVGVYSFILTSYLFRMLFMRDKSNSMHRFLRKYFIILIIALCLSLIAAASESFLVPSITKLFVKIFI